MKLHWYDIVGGCGGIEGGGGGRDDGSEDGGGQGRREIRFLTFRVTVEEPGAHVSLLWSLGDLLARRRGHAGGLYSSVDKCSPQLHLHLHLATFCSGGTILTPV